MPEPNLVVPRPPRPNISTARVCSIVGFVCAALAVPFAPLLFGLVAVVLGVSGAVLGDRPLGWYAAAAGVVGAAIGSLLRSGVFNL